MKILHITTSAYPQSACTRINNSLLKLGIESKILTFYYNENDDLKTYRATNNFNTNIGKINNRIEKVILRNFEKETENVFSISLIGVDISDNPLIKEADILHLHWINGGFLSLKSIKKLYRTGKKIVWTFHDSWPFTGGCHVRYDCEKYKVKCVKCPLLKMNFIVDPIKIMWEKKEKLYETVKIRGIVPSTYHYKVVTDSQLGKNFDITMVNNPINTDIYRQYDRDRCREKFNIDKDSIVIAFGAVNVEARYKGLNYLLEALKILANQNDISRYIQLVIFGDGNNKLLKSMIEKFELNAVMIGYVSEENELAMLYSASDVFVSPSIEESFGQTFAESMACGTIAIGFDNTGAIDVIDHKVNGYLAKHSDIYDLAEGILWGISNSKGNEIRETARKKIINSFNYKKIAKDYLNVYKKTLKEE